MIILFSIKVLFIIAIFSKAWLDVKGNKNQLDHIVTGMFEASLIIGLYLILQFGYISLINTGAWGIVVSYLLLRIGLFDSFRGQLAHTKYPHLGNNNWLDLQKQKLYDWGMKKKFPILQIVQFFSITFGLIL